MLRAFNHLFFLFCIYKAETRFSWRFLHVVHASCGQAIYQQSSVFGVQFVFTALLVQCPHYSGKWFIPKPSLKIRTANAICWNSLGLFIDYGLNYIFVRNKTFLFFEIESWKLLASVWKLILWNLTKFQLNQTTKRKNRNSNCLNELNELKFCEVSRNSFSSLSFLSWKTKKFYS